ncbi:hypothetical protein J3F84DRAFT_380965 [Trichoderma pleuroticola]
MLFTTPVTLLLGMGVSNALATPLEIRSTESGHCIKYPNKIEGGCRLDSNGQIYSCTYGSCIGDDGRPLGSCSFNTDSFVAWCPSA